MRIRSKLLLLLTALGLSAVVALSVAAYLRGVRAVEARLRGEVERAARGMARDVGARLQEREDALTALARSPALRAYVRREGVPSLAPPASGSRSELGKSQAPSHIGSSEASVEDFIPKDVKGEVSGFIQSGGKHYVGLTCLDVSGRPQFRAEPGKSGDGQAVRFQTRDFYSESLRLDEKVWNASEPAALRSPITRESFGSVLRYTVAIFTGEENATAQRGALIVDLKLDPSLSDAAKNVLDPSEPQSNSSNSPPPLVVMLDRAGNAIFHSNDALRYQPAATALPSSFGPITEAMNAGRSGWRSFQSFDGDDWVAAYQPVAPLDLSVAVAGNYSVAVRDLRWVGWLSTGLIALIGLGTILLLQRYLRRMARDLGRITEGAVAIAGGKLDQRIDVRSSDESRVLAETFNAMGNRLREQIAREAESRQFESFLRLSAMLTHDLKNAIQALSLIVGNMEQQFHREEFRADMMQSLRDATAQLSGLVAKLSEPVRSLSGEFKRPRKLDLVPAIKRALARTAEPAALMHEIDIQLPASLVASADDERIEKVVENLALNALEAMGTEPGKLSVTAGLAEEGFVFFMVCDTGPGMTEEFQRNRLFHPFATTKPKGIGLGLYTCHELVRALGGRVEVESKRGSGACFRIVLPSGAITEDKQQSDRIE